MFVNSPKWITPLMKQCWVCSGVALNFVQIGFVFGITSTMVPALKSPGSPIPIDEECGSWIVAIPGISLPGTLIGTIMMGKYCRKASHLTLVIMLAVGWLLTAFSTNVPMLLVARCLKGTSLGILYIIGSILIGEYSSPTYRGVLLMSLGVCVATGVLAILAMSLYIAWETVSLICAGVALLTLVIVILSPESPSFLAVKGRYEECANTFRWLRGENEEQELQKLINSRKLANETSKEKTDSNETLIAKMRNQYHFLKSYIGKVKFYAPIVIMIHVYTMAQYSGVSLFCSYAVDLVKLTLGDEVDVRTTVIWLNVQRTVSTMVFMIIVKKVKRKTVLRLSGCLNITIMILAGVNSFARIHNLLLSHSILAGYIILHVHYFSIATGCMPLSYILAGEVYPLQYKSLASGLCAVLVALQIFVNLKTVPFLLSTIRLYGIYWLYASVQIFCLIVSSLLLPETKDRTLQDIEEELKNRNKHTKTAERYTSKADLF